MNMKIWVVWGGMSLGMAMSAAAAVQINGGSTFPTVQGAVNAATNGDTLRISFGVYPETVVVSNKDLTLEGGYDAAFTSRTGGDSILDAQHAGTTLWIMDSSSRVDRVQLTGGVGEPANFWVGGGSLLHRSWVEFMDCPIYSNTATYGGGLFVGLFSYAKLTGETIVQSNQATFSGGGIFDDGRCDMVSPYARVLSNSANEGNGGGIWVETGYLRVFNGGISYNQALAGGAGVTAAGGGIGAIGSFVEIGDDLQMYLNDAVVGGGIALYNSTGHLGRAHLKDVTLGQSGASAYGGSGYASNSIILARGLLVENSQAVQGGGFYFDACSVTSDTNGLSTINCRASGNGGGWYFANSTVDVTRLNCGEVLPLTGNMAGENGGGLFASGSWLRVKGACFAHNLATNPLGSPHGMGGGLYLDHSYLSISNSPDYDAEGSTPFFEDNQASTNLGYGGAICYTASSTVEVFRAVFSTNTADFGGALFGGWGTELILTDCELMHNRAWNQDGGGLGLLNNQAVIQHCLFEQNTAGYAGGAISADAGTHLEITDTSLLNNQSLYKGGALYADGTDLTLTGTGPYDPVDDVWPMLFQGNVAVQGGGASLNYSTATVSHVAWISNSAPGYASGLMQISGSLDMDNSLIARGTMVPDGSGASPGAGLSLLSWAGCHLFACTIAENEGDGVRLYDADFSASNSVIWGNLAGNIQTESVATITISYSDIDGGWPGTGNINSDPEFYSTYHLRSGSPCIDMGDPGTVAPGTWADQDIDGESRSLTRCDMGFDEFLDSDADRMPDIVETGTGVYSNETNMGTSPLLPDSDGDSASDGDEWVAGTNPTRKNDFLHFSMIETPSGTQQLVHVISGETASLILEVCTATRSNAVWQFVENLTPPTSRTNIIPVNWGLPPEKANFRIRASRP